MLHVAPKMMWVESWGVCIKKIKEFAGPNGKGFSRAIAGEGLMGWNDPPLPPPIEGHP